MMAYRAGAELAGMEFAQFSAWSYFNKEFFTPGQAKIQGIGSHFINNAGERFMDRYDPIWGEQTGLIQLARGIITENLEGRGPCSVDMRHVAPKDIETLYHVAPAVERAFKEFNVDPLKDTMTINPMMVIATSSSSGMRIGLNGDTNVAGLYAAGACTCLPHMMAGISGSAISTASHVTGYRAGVEMGAAAKKSKQPQIHEEQVKAALDQFFAPQRKFRPTRPTDVHDEIARVTCEAEFALFKNADRIERTIANLDALEDMLPKMYAPNPHELVKAQNARNYLHVTQLVTRAMLARQESRAELFRVDFPYRDNENWLKWLIVRQDEAPDAEPTLDFWDLPYDSWAVKPPVEKVPTTYFIPDQYKQQAA